MSKQGHWEGQKADPCKHFGFIYIIEDLTSGHAYIGKKQYWVKKSGVKGCKTAVAHKTGGKWKPSCWRESNWREYKGSSKTLTKWMKKNPSNEYRFTILRQCVSRAELTFMEVKYMWKYEVMEEYLPSGYRKFFNLQIPAIKFVPPQSDIHQFINGTGGFRGTIEEFLRSHSHLTRAGVTGLVNGTQKTHKGWRYEGPSRGAVRGR